MVIIYLSRHLRTGINLPTLDLGRAILSRVTGSILYMAFQLARFTRLYDYSYKL